MRAMGRRFVRELDIGRLVRAMGRRFVRELDIGRKAQIAPFSSVDVLTRPAIFRRYSLVLLSLRLNMLFSLDILGHL